MRSLDAKLMVHIRQTHTGQFKENVFEVNQFNQAIPYWLKTFPDMEARPMIFVRNLVDSLERDLVKLRALKTLDNPGSAYKSEIGSEVYGEGDYYDEGASIDSVISYAENLIKVLTEYCGDYKP